MSTIADVPESHRDLLEAQLTAVLTTVDAQGRPQSTAVWYLLHDGDLIASVTDSRQKYENLASNPQVHGGDGQLARRARAAVPNARRM